MGEYIGLDVSLEETHVCVVGQDGSVVGRANARTDPSALAKLIVRLAPARERVVLETGAQSAAVQGADAQRDGQLGLGAHAPEPLPVLARERLRVDVGHASHAGAGARWGVRRRRAPPGGAPRQRPGGPRPRPPGRHSRHRSAP